MMTLHEYQFLTDQWDGSPGAAYNQVYEFCKAFRWTYGFDRDGVPILTELGKREIRKFEEGPPDTDDEEKEENAQLKLDI